MISGWKTTELLVNNETIEFYNLRKYITILECEDKYHTSVFPENHCKLQPSKEGWGCQHLSSISRYSSYYYYGDHGSYWYHFGKFRSDTVWEIDKIKIKDALKREAELKKLFLCKIFDFKKVENIVDTLPDEIDLEKSDLWETEYEEIEDGITIEKKPIRIKPKRDQGNSRSGFGLKISLGSKDENEDEKKRYIPEVAFKDIGGIEDIIETIREVIELPLKTPKLFEYMGIRPHKGVLLYGSPGCGKTLIAKAIANEINAHFISIKGPELLSKWHGQSEENLRNVFEEARDFQPSIIYFDEIDSIAQSRSSEETLRIDSRFVNQLLTLMDGIEDYGNVCVIASTNRKELIDEALLRPGRFDYSIEVKKPTKNGCFKIFSIHTRQMPLSEGFDAKGFSDKLLGLSGAEISFIAREGAYNCLRRNLDLKKIIENNSENNIHYGKFKITQDDFEEALGKIRKTLN